MFAHNDIVRLALPATAPDHDGSIRLWSVRTVFRVLHPTRTGEVVVTDDSRGLRVTFQAAELVMHQRAEQPQRST